jgi:hypothetical protein
MINSPRQIGPQRSIDFLDRKPRPRRSSAGQASTTDSAAAFGQEIRNAARSGSGTGGGPRAVRQNSVAGAPEGQNSATTNASRAIGWSIFGGISGASATPSTPAAVEPSASAPTAAKAVESANTDISTAKSVADSATRAAPASYATRADTDAAIVQSLKDALTAAGIGYDGLGLGAHEDIVTYPGGSYINRYISVNTNGHVEGLMTDLVGINPKVAVLDIKRMLGLA